MSTVRVTPSAATLEEGANVPLSCVAQDARGLVLSIAGTWSSSDEGVATVAANGTVVGRRAGTAKATCTVDGRTASVALTVTASPVAFVDVSPGAGTLVIGNSMQLTGTPRDARGVPVPGREVQWVSADTAVAEVSASGTVIARIEGIASVIGMSGGKASFARINVSAKPVAPVASISVTLDDSSLNIGKSGHANAVTTDANGNVLTGRSIVWSVSDPKVMSAASTSAQKALVSPLAPGTSILTATCEGQSASVSVSVAPQSGQTITTPTVQTVSVTLGASTILPGQSTQATAVLSDASGNVITGPTVTWTSLDPMIATVAADGTVTGIATGAVIIRATADGKTGDATLTVSVPPVATVSVSFASPSLAVGQTTQATAVARDAGGHVLTGRSVAWSSLTPSVATVSIGGMVTAVAAGSATIRATVESKTGDGILSVGAAVATVVVTLDASTLAIGQTTQATAVARDASGATITGRAVTWTAVTPSIATISPTGLVTAVAAGAATVRATVDGKTADAALTVATAAGTVATVAVTLDHSSVPVGQAAQAVAVAKDAAGTVLTGRSVTWASLTPTIATVSTAGVVTTLAGGTATIRATVDTKTGDGVLAVTQQVTVAPSGPVTDVTGPTLLVTSVASTPSAGRTLRVAASGNLQRALDSAVAGDRILLAAGATFTGNFVLRAKGGGIPGGWITVQSDGALPPEGTRMTATAAAGFNLPRLATASVLPVLSTEAGAARWRIIGVEMTNDPSALFNYGLVLLGDGSTAQNTQASIPRNIILDRTYIHGTTTSDSRRCVALNSDSTAVIDSYVSECHSNGFDTQAVFGWNGNGPYKIVNNYLEASTEVTGFGGADPAIQGLVPSDIEIRGNHITRPMSWKGGPWLIKNLVELKNARRVLIEGNVLENSWPQAQIGWAFVLFSVNQNGGCGWCVVQDVTIRNNLIRNVASGISLSDMYHGAGSVDATPMNRIVISNNVMIGVDNPTVTGGGGYGFQINRAIATLHIEHNTFFVPSISAFQWNVPTLAPDQVIRNNVTGGARYTLYASPTNTWASMAGPGSDFAGNVIAMADGTYYLPTQNWFPATLDGVGLAGGSAAAFSVTSPPSSLALSSSSPYKGKATDGTDPGANMSAILTATAGVVIP